LIASYKNFAEKNQHKKTHVQYKQNKMSSKTEKQQKFFQIVKAYKDKKMSAAEVKDSFYHFYNTINTYSLELIYNYSETIR
jgi:hypothetical protein